MSTKGVGKYRAILERVFRERFEPGKEEVEFVREDLSKAAEELGIPVPKNLGDTVYSFRYRALLPESIRSSAPKGKEWIIEGRGDARYAFRLSTAGQIEPNPHLKAIKIPDATPELVEANSLTDEQSLLAKVRYNRLIDIFLGIAAYSLQSHLRTKVAGVGQIEIDELYVGVDRNGCQFVIPVQAKGGKDKLSVVQIRQDIVCCDRRFPGLICRSVAAQFVTKRLIALFELTLENECVKIAEERHYELVPADEITREDLSRYSQRS